MFVEEGFRFSRSTCRDKTVSVRAGRRRKVKSVRYCRFQGRRKLQDAPELIFGKGLTALHWQEGTSFLI